MKKLVVSLLVASSFIFPAAYAMESKDSKKTETVTETMQVTETITPDTKADEPSMHKKSPRKKHHAKRKSHAKKHHAKKHHHHSSPRCGGPKCDTGQKCH